MVGKSSRRQRTEVGAKATDELVVALLIGLGARCFQRDEPENVGEQRVHRADDGLVGEPRRPQDVVDRLTKAEPVWPESRLMERQRDDRRVVEKLLAERLADRSELIGPVGGGIDGEVEAGVDLIDQAIDQVGFALHVRVQRIRADMEALCQPAHRKRIRTVLLEEGESRLDDLLARQRPKRSCRQRCDATCKGCRVRGRCGCHLYSVQATVQYGVQYTVTELMPADRNRTSNSRPARLGRYVSCALAAGAIVRLLMLYERRLLARLHTTPDEDDGDWSFPQERTYEVETPDGGSIHVAECGAGRPIVLLHGHGASLEIFARLAARLAAAGQLVIAIDHRGFGRSSAMPATFGFDGLIDDVATVLERLDLRGAVIVGHSMGGAVALGLAVNRPEIVDERVAALVLVNSTARGPADRRLVRAKATVFDWSITERVGRHPRVGVLVSSMNFGVDARHSHVVAARAAGAMSPASRRPGFTRRLLGIDLSEGLANVSVPVLALAGSADRVLAVSESEWIIDRVPDGRLEVFAGAGHVLPVERSGPVAEVIVRFADDLDHSG